MEVNAVLNELDLARNIVCSFLRTDRTLVVIETECVRFYRQQHGSDTVSNCDIRCHRLFGYTIAASLYKDPLTAIQYVILLKGHGVLEIRNTELEIVDTLDLQDIELDIASPRDIFFLFDDESKYLFINLEPCVIYQIGLQSRNSTLRFVKTERPLMPIVESNYPIISMDAASCFDVYTGEEMMMISMVSRNTSRSKLYFRVIFSTIVHSKRKYIRNSWKVLIPSKELPLQDDEGANGDGSDAIGYNQILLKTVPNIGFFVFASTKTFVFPIPKGYGVCINGCKVEDYYEASGVPMERETVTFEHSSPRLLSHMLSDRTLHSVEFQIVDNTASLVSISCEKVFEDEDEFTIYWGDLIVKKKYLGHIETKSPIRKGEEIISKSFYLGQGHQYLFQLKSNSLIWFDLDSDSTILSLPFNCVNYVYSNMIGYEVPRIVRTGVSMDEKCYIDRTSVDHSKFVSVSKLYDLKSYQVENMWCANDNDLWWVDTEMNLYKNGKFSQIISRNASGFFVTRNSTLVHGDSNTLQIVEVGGYGDDAGSYCILTKNGISQWEGGHLVGSQTYPNDIGDPNKLRSAVVLPVKSKFGDEFTFYAVDNKLTVVRNREVFGQLTFRDDQIDTISSMCHQYVGKDLYLCVGDVYGKLCIINVIKMTVLDIFRINFHSIRLVSLPSCDMIVVYSRDTLIVMKFLGTDYDGRPFKLARLDIPLNIKLLAASTTNRAFFLTTTENSIYRLHIDPENVSFNEIFSRSQIDVLVTKFVQLPCSQRYIVGSYIEVGEHNKDVPRSGLCVIDLFDGAVVQKMEISSMYPETSVSDITPASYMPFRKGAKKVFFAKQLIFDQCLLVSLSYEMSGSDALENMLLFLFDNDRIELELKSSFNTGYNVTCLYNYVENAVIATGDFTQIFELNYSVKENTFTISPNVSTNLITGGYISSLFPVYTTDSTLVRNPTKAKRPKGDKGLTQSFLGLDLFRGLIEFRTKVTEPSALAELLFEIDHVSVPLRNPVLRSISQQELITHFAISHSVGMSWLTLCCGPNLIKVYVLGATQSADPDEKYEMFGFSLSSQVTSLVAVDQRTANVGGIGNDISVGGTVVDLFLITTLNNGHYVLNTLVGGGDRVLKLASSPEQKKLLVSIGFLGGAEGDDEEEKGQTQENEENSVPFIDNRPFGSKTIMKWCR